MSKRQARLLKILLLAVLFEIGHCESDPIQFSLLELLLQRAFRKFKKHIVFHRIPF